MYVIIKQRKHMQKYGIGFTDITLRTDYLNLHLTRPLPETSRYQQSLQLRVIRAQGFHQFSSFLLILHPERLRPQYSFNVAKGNLRFVLLHLKTT